MDNQFTAEDGSYVFPNISAENTDHASDVGVEYYCTATNAIGTIRSPTVRAFYAGERENGCGWCLVIITYIYIYNIMYTCMLCCGFKYHLSHFLGESCCVVVLCFSESEFAIYYYTYLLHMQHFLDFEMVQKLRLVQSQIQHQWML